MKKITEKLNYEKFQDIYETILNIYPFLNKSEKDFFIKKTSKLIKDDSKFKKNSVEFLEKLLSLLKNPHAVLFKLTKKSKIKGKKKKYFEHEIIDQILYIKIPRWYAKNDKEDKKRADQLIKLCFKKRNFYKGLIIDVRGNTGGWSCGAHKFSSIFFKRIVNYGKVLKKRDNRLKVTFMKLVPHKDIYIDVPIIILIDRICFSSNELFIGPFKIGKRAIIIGEKTRGGSAAPQAFSLSYRNRELLVKIPTWRFFLKGEKKPLEETGIKPDIFYKKKDILDYSFKMIKQFFLC